MLKVMKFGGSSLATRERVNNVADIVTSNFNNGPLVVVLSAIGGVTDMLIQAAQTAEKDGNKGREYLQQIREKHQQVYPNELKNKAIDGIVDSMFTELHDLLKGVSLVHECSLRTMDYTVSFGERFNCQLMTQLLTDRGFDAEYLDSREVLFTNNVHGGARVLFQESYKAIKNRITENKIYIVTGFIGSTGEGITTTLGRGGSDYTASLFGAALQVDQIEIWTDVDGFMSADPRMVKEAFVLPRVSYEEAMELSYFGAKVIHPQTMVPAIKKDIPVLIKNSFAPDNPGTVISPDKGDFEHPVKGIASFNGISLINLQGGGMVGVPGIAGRLFGALARQKINVVMITQASSEHSISFAILSSQAQDACKTLELEFEAELFSGKIDKIDRTDDLSIIAAVGENMAGTPGISGKLFGALGRNSVNVRAIAQGSSERNVSLVVNKGEAEKAVNVMHSAFYLSHRISNVFIIGAGSIGTTLIEQIREKQAQLVSENNLHLNICGITNSKRMIFNEKGINLDNWREQLDNSNDAFSLKQLLEQIHSLELANSILVDVTASTTIASYYETIISSGIHIVTPNKKANTMEQDYYDQIMDLVKDHRLHYYYETTVGAGLPLIGTIKNLLNSGDKIYKIEGILSGTMSYLFNTISKDRSFSEVVKEAHEKGFTEPDPRDDLSGMDVGRKLLILGREIGLKMELDNVEVQSLLDEDFTDISLPEFWEKLPSIDEPFEQRRLEAEKIGMALRYIAKLDKDGCRVAVEEVPLSSALAQSGATDNIIQITTERYNENPLIVQGPGAGREVTAGGVFADIISLAFHLS